MSTLHSERPGTRTVSARHRFDPAALCHWLERNLTGCSGPIEVRQFSGGQSNPTFHVVAPGFELVLRKQPPGPLKGGAHAIDREYRVLTALAGSDVPVPTARGYCSDPQVIGTPFYLMDYQPGRIFTDPLLPGIEPAERSRLYDAMNDALARLHQFPWREAGLADFGRPERYVERQIARWRQQYESTREAPLESMDRLGEWLTARVPEDESPTLAHGDYRIGNLIFHEHEPRVVAILDWELATLGNPLCDLAYNCLTYYLPANHPVAAGFAGLDIASAGIPAEEAYIATYARRTGRPDVPHWRFYLAFSLYRVAAIQCGVYRRALSGTASSDTAHLFRDTYRLVAETAWTLVAGH